MRKTLFSYNNELVSHGSRIKEELVAPLVAHLEVRDELDLLTTLTDSECVDLAVERDLVSDIARSHFIPDLDYMRTQEPHRSFRGFLKEH